MGEVLSELCLSVNYLHASAIGLPTSCSPEQQLPKSDAMRHHPNKFSHFLSIVLLFLSKGKKRSYVWACFYNKSNVNMLPIEPCICASEREDHETSDTGDISVDSAAVQVGSFIHCIMPL